jgi:cytoskeletal protein CcmA (bactofilin family)
MFTARPALRAATVGALLLCLMAPPVNAGKLSEDFAIFAGNGVSLTTQSNNVDNGLVGSNGLVTIASGTFGGGLAGGGDLKFTSSSNYIHGDVTFNGNVDLNAYAHIYGDLNCGGNANLGSSYNLYRNAAGNVAAGGSLSMNSGELDGNAKANGDVTMTSSAKIVGNLTYGGNLSQGPNAVVTGTVTKAPVTVDKTYTPQVLPPATIFTPGAQSVSAKDLTLAPGSYGDVAQSNGHGTLHLSSGNYYLRSLTTYWTDLYLDLSNGPINVFSTGDMKLGSGMNVYVNGQSVSAGNSGLDRVLAKNVLFETHGNFTLASGFLNHFFGNIFAPNGRIDLESQDIFGSMIAGDTVTAYPHSVQLYHYSSNYLAAAVPEPSAMAMLCAAALGMLGWRWRARRKLAEA